MLSIPLISILLLAGDPPLSEAAPHWAWRPLSRPEPPAAREGSRARTAIDRFIEKALAEKGLAIGAEADRAALLRRVSFDLTGLPPAPAEIALFLADPDPEAYERMVERFLASPAYGERWGRQWLDAAGYSDSNGYFSADSERPVHWRYRDWVVRATNEDRPFDRFVREQLSGDEIAAFDPAGDVGPETAELLTATGYLRNSQDGTGESDGNELEVLIDKLTVLDGTLQIVGTSLMGVTLQCARCHDHKFDPVSQADYYQLRAVFAGGYAPERWLKPADRLVAAGTRAEREEHAAKKGRVEKEIEALNASLEAFAGPLKKRLVEERLAALPEVERQAIQKAREVPKEKRSGEEKALIQKHQHLLETKDEDLAKRFPEYATTRASVHAGVEAKEKELPAPLPRIAALYEASAEAAPHRLLVRGNAAEPGPAVEPGIPAGLCAAAPFKVEKLPRSSGRRSAFAAWITAPENPLLARVTANRLWQGHFGRGLVATADNFGRAGALPSHPELLDFLAAELAREKWSQKAIHRLILRSAVYRQSGRASGEALEKDPEDLLLSRFPSIRLDAEGFRDALLAVSGELDRRAGGPPTPTHRDGDGQVVVDEKDPGAFRRSIYLQSRRTQLPAILELFDEPLVVTCCARRGVSTTPLQSLALLNSHFVRERARAFAERVRREAGEDREARLSIAFLLAFGRGPRAEERALSVRFLEESEREHAAGDGTKSAGAKDPRAAAAGAWLDLCQSLFGMNAFLYGD